MNKIKIGIYLIISIFFMTSAIAQIEPLYKYDIIDIDDYNGYSMYGFQGKKYYRYNKTIKINDIIIYSYEITKDKDTIFSIKTEDITFFSIYKKRYLFVSYYPKQQKESSLGFR